MGKLAIRWFDVTLALGGIIVFSPILVVACIGSYFETGSPILRQLRIGLSLRTFVIYKIRTLPLDTKWVATHELGASVSPPGPICKFLRHWKIDELPQLFNVVQGSMSLVGPRPCLLSQSELISARSEANVYSVPPGITGLPQIRGIDMSVPKELVRHEVEMIEGFSLLRYLLILILTVRAIG